MMPEVNRILGWGLEQESLEFAKFPNFSGFSGTWAPAQHPELCNPGPARTVDSKGCASPPLHVPNEASPSQSSSLVLLINCRTRASKRNAVIPRRFSHSAPAAEDMQAFNPWGNPVLRKADAKAANDDDAKAQRAKRFGAGAKSAAVRGQYLIADQIRVTSCLL